ncbi:4Fe-4S dicluster domain-containing protein [Serpentinicella sp. ANB-PHB4]|uniref:4Fe-4S dicluster domain-containing protein n=1 Tax=Serpentinicella sp. ANB-PHB4 TaxID=3074076 RepID=UPI002866E9E1|nr:4Fe-4S dicluster domain-containing protein [Serpentinicella sp. ANB-PHB4]MDR5659828.1 4Fe-4S dicluster domain-containing protein [Serpentinicella sp. ANB-PHB4]
MAKKGSVTFDEKRCKGCELCTTVCPVNIVVMDKKQINVKGYHPATVDEMEKCIGCANCATICPDVVITVEKDTDKKTDKK